MQKPMNPYVYSMYMLILKHGMKPNDIYLACKNRTANVPHSVIIGPYGNETRPTPRPVELMRTWLYRNLKGAELNNGQGPLHPLDNFEWNKLYFMPLSLANFIADHATDDIDLTWWDRLKRWFR